jgi:pseudouridine synthase
VIRLQKILSHAGVASRRAAEELIRQHRVEVNGAVVTELGTKADPEHDEIRVDGRRLPKASPVRRYVLMFKPREVMSTRADPQRRTTVIELLGRAGIHGYFYPVGRLDFESEGLLVLTNDGEFAERLTHPRHEVERVYEAHLLGVPDERDIHRLQRGIVIDGRRTRPARIHVRGTYAAGREEHTLVEITLHEGRNRQVRRMCEAIGHPVVRLIRTRIGTIADKRLRPGQIRDLTPQEVASLMEGASPARRRPLRPKPGARAR